MRKLGFSVIKISESEEVGDEIKEEGFMIFLEQGLENYLVNNIEKLEEGLKLIGRQVEVITGREVY